MGKVLAIDYGAVRIGIALSDETGTVAFGREAVPSNGKAIDRIKKIASEENVTFVIIGYPLNLKSEKTRLTLEVEAFEEKLKSAFNTFPFNNISISRWDERFTSKMAADSLIQSGMKKSKRQDKSNLDIVSAALLLQSYLDSIKK
jgi:putative Holliday junction resolvase